MESFRIVDAQYAARAFDGEGARRTGGRWNSPGVPMVYTACHRSLAMLEMLVHLEYQDILSEYWRIIPVNTGEHAIERAAPLPARVAEFPAPAETRAFGDDWVRSNRSVGLLVPSVVVPGEFNLLLNPIHPDFATTVVTGDPERLIFDPRLAQSR